VFLFYELAGAAPAIRQSGTNIIEEDRITWGDVFNIALYVPGAIASKFGAGRFLRTARGSWQQLRQWATGKSAALWDNISGPWIGDPLVDLGRQLDNLVNGPGGI